MSIKSAGKNRLKSTAIILLLCVCLFSLIGCSFRPAGEIGTKSETSGETEEEEKLYAYPCYYNADVEGMNASVAIEKLKNTDFVLYDGGDLEFQDESIFRYLIKRADGTTPKDTAVLRSYETNELAEKNYDREYQEGQIAIFELSTVRISDFVLSGTSDVLQEILIALEIWENKEMIPVSETVRVLSADRSEQNFSEITEKMKTDGYAVYTSEDTEFSCYTVLNREGTRMFLLIELKQDVSAAVTATAWVEMAKDVNASDMITGTTYTIVGTRQIVVSVGDTFCELEGYLK